MGETQLFLFSDPPRRWFYFDYDPGPFSCVHLQVFIFIFIIAPPKIGVNPKPWIYRNFILQKHRTRFPLREKAVWQSLQPLTCCRQKSISAENANALRQHRKIVFCQNKTPSSVLRHTEKGVLFGYCLGVRRNHVTREAVAAPLPMAKV